jgi:hypothetical protein
MGRLSAFAAFAALAATFVPSAWADPSPQVQTNITAAIRAAAHANGTIDYTKFVNPFVGTGQSLLFFPNSAASDCLSR